MKRARTIAPPLNRDSARDDATQVAAVLPGRESYEAKTAVPPGATGLAPGGYSALDGASHASVRFVTLALSYPLTVPRHHRCTTRAAFERKYGTDDDVGMRHCARFRAVEDYTNKYKGE